MTHSDKRFESDQDRDDDQRCADRDDHRDRAGTLGPLLDDRVEQTRVVQGRAGHGERRDPEERAHPSRF